MCVYVCVCLYVSICEYASPVGPLGSCLQAPVRSRGAPEGVCCWTLVFYCSSSKHDRLFGDHLFPMAAAW